MRRLGADDSLQLEARGLDVLDPPAFRHGTGRQCAELIDFRQQLVRRMIEFNHALVGDRRQRLFLGDRVRPTAFCRQRLDLGHDAGLDRSCHVAQPRPRLVDGGGQLISRAGLGMGVVWPRDGKYCDRSRDARRGNRNASEAPRSIGAMAHMAT